MSYWAGKFKDASSKAEFGTLFGNHTVQELKDLIAAKDIDIQQLNTQQADFTHQWTVSDPTAAASWINDLTALNNRYDAAKDAAESYLATSALDLTALGSEAAYNAILDALNPSWKQNTPAPGSIDDLFSRIQKAGMKVKTYAVPQPTKGSDYDFNMFQSANTAIKDIEKAEKTAAGYAPYLVVGGVALGALVLIAAIKL